MQLCYIKCYLHCHPAPGPPDFLGQYLRIKGSDYAQQTMAFNALDDTFISEEQMIVCYNQTI